MDQSLLRNIGIIAHVDHGKTTLIDCLLRQAGLFRSNESVETCVMDSNDLEKERGITIFSKNASIQYKDYKINVVDTPGHADFGGEVERILKMVNGVLLLVDAAEGPMPQTKFVLKKALEHGLCPIVVVNKIDRKGADPDKVLDQVFDLFVALGANDKQLDFSTIYASAKMGFCRLEPEGENLDMAPLLDLIVDKVDPHLGDPEEPFQMLVSSIDYNDYVGRIAIGKIMRGSVDLKSAFTLIRRSGDHEQFKISKILAYEGLKPVEVAEAIAGDIIGISGMKDVDIGETVACAQNPEALPVIEIDEPTLSVNFSVNNSPFAGKEGKFLTSRHLRERLFREIKSNVSLRIEETNAQDTFRVSGRGELHLTILIETMRREGYEFSVSMPEVILKKIDDKLHEPQELAVIDVSEEYSGKVMELMGPRKGAMKDMSNPGNGQTRLEFVVPTRGLFGFTNEFLTATKGTGIINRIFHGYIPFCGEISRRTAGVLIALEHGKTTGFSLYNLQERGTLFLAPGEEIYTGMIIGGNRKSGDLIVNACKEKKLTNMRASGSDDNITLVPPRKMSLEQVLEFVSEDELAEITPETIRLRKRILDENERKRYTKSRQVA